MKLLARCAVPLLLAAAVSVSAMTSDSSDDSAPPSSTMLSETLEEDVSFGWFVRQ